MRRLVSIAIAFALTACGAEEEDNSPKLADVPLLDDPAAYFERFQTQGRTRLGMPDFTVTTPFRWLPASAMPTTVGQTADAICSWPASGGKEIVVNIDSWGKTTHGGQREALLFHELGHCELNRPHLNDDLPSGRPVSLMSESIDWISYLYEYERYQAELFSLGILKEIPK